ncbi:MAG TPA: hypothetical protein VLR49_16365 [Ferruginibacter sp.]|nr:hypothetical protein [Ferruginibacter sp.]
MSQAFVRENDENGLLHEIKPTIPALVNYIKAENTYTPVFVRQINKVKGISVVMMSTGISYFINEDDNWEMCL